MHKKLKNLMNCIQALKKGKMIIVTDDENRENEGDFIMAAEFSTPNKINFMTKYGRGLICSPITDKIANNLNLSLMVNDNQDEYSTAFTVSIDFKTTKTGISAFERSTTIRKLANCNSKKEDFKRPGHIFPLIANPNGLNERDGHTEATIELLNIANLYPVGVICEILNDDGTMARYPDLLKISKNFNIPIISIKEIIFLKKYIYNSIIVGTVANLPTDFGNFNIQSFTGLYDNKDHIALIYGNIKDIKKHKTLPIRIHSECLTGDVLTSKKCDCGNQLHKSLEIISKNKAGIIIYLRQEGRGIGLSNKIHAYKLQDDGLDTVEANLELGFDDDLRNYEIAADILKYLKIKKVDLITNNPDKINNLKHYGITINKRIPINVGHCPTNRSYLKTKKERMGHLLDIK